MSQASMISNSHFLCPGVLPPRPTLRWWTLHCQNYEWRQWRPGHHVFICFDTMLACAG